MTQSMPTGILYIVATPIGNLADITLRAIDILRSVDCIACEDTRVTRKLTSHHKINKPLISYHHHSKIAKIDEIVGKLKDGKDIAQVTDAGTPGISDPGNLLVQKAVENGIRVVPIPGASTIGAMISIAGIDMQRFIFLGFPPHKKGRETFFKEVVASRYPVMYFESPHRVIKNLELLKSFNPQKKIILGRELTKMFEEIARGTIGEVLEHFKNNPGKIKGEFAVIIYTKSTNKKH